MGEGSRKITAEYPIMQIKGWKGPRKPANLPSQACEAGWGVPSIPHVVPLPQTVNIGVVTSLIKASVSLKNMESG
jgi:hypothetical protein